MLIGCRYSPEFPYDDYGEEGSLSPHPQQHHPQHHPHHPHQQQPHHLGYSRQDSGYSHDPGYPSDHGGGGGYDPGYSTDHGYVSDPLPYGDYSGRVGVAGVGGGHQNETQALVALDKAYNTPVAFSVRTNVMYDGTLDDDSPVHGSAVR